MTYSGEHQLFSFHGVLPGNEIWSCGLRVVGAGVPITAALLAVMTQKAADRWRTFAAGQQTAGTWAIGTTFAGVTGRTVSAAGLTVQLVEKAPATALPAGSVNPTLPNQCCLALTLSSATISRRGRGRIYLPILSVNPDVTTGKVTPAIVTAMLTALKTMIDGMHTDWHTAAVTPFPRVQVMSRVGAGAAAPVTGLKLGDVIDTQRRRRSNIIETYQSAVLV